MRDSGGVKSGLRPYKRISNRAAAATCISPESLVTMVSTGGYQNDGLFQLPPASDTMPAARWFSAAVILISGFMVCWFQTVRPDTLR